MTTLQLIRIDRYIGCGPQALLETGKQARSVSAHDQCLHLCPVVGAGS